MNVEIGNIGTEAAHFPEKEYINGIFIAVFTLYSVEAKVVDVPDFNVMNKLLSVIHLL
jgi:hypothetical protein